MYLRIGYLLLAIGYYLDAALPRWGHCRKTELTREALSIAQTNRLHPAPMIMQTLERFSGCLLGLAIGDAVGTTLEFQPPGSFTPINDMVGGGPFKLEPGQWTDDTSLALCLAASLTECRRFDPRDQMQRYVKWWREGYMSSTGDCFDIGTTTSEALRTFERTGNPCGLTDLHKAGNGSLLRLALVPMFYFKSPQEAIERAGEDPRTTHGAPNRRGCLPLLRRPYRRRPRRRG